MRGQWSKSWQWNAYGEATSVDYQHGSQPRYGYSLDYNATGQIISKVERLPDGSSQTYDYTYDNRYRLIEVRRNNQLVEAYGYDANGNRTLHTSADLNIINRNASYTQGDQLQSHGNSTYLYDANGRLSSKLTASEEGLGLTTYVYSSQGQLLQVDTPEQAISYRHNALGNRVAKLIDGVVTEQYLWQDLTTLLAIYDGAGQLKQRFEYTLGHTPTSFTQDGQRYFIQADHLGSPRVITDSSGSVVKVIDYDSYGNITQDSNPEFAIPFGFAGGLQDADTGLIRFGYRDYDPLTGRWTARDPIGFAGGDTNLYGYVLGDPVNSIDPFGLFEVYSHPTQSGSGVEARYEFNFSPIASDAGSLMKFLHKIGRMLNRLTSIINVFKPEPVGPKDAKPWNSVSGWIECGNLDAELDSIYKQMFDKKNRLNREDALRFLEQAYDKHGKQMSKFYDSPEKILNQADSNSRNHWYTQWFYPGF